MTARFLPHKPWGYTATLILIFMPSLLWSHHFHHCSRAELQRGLHSPISPVFFNCFVFDVNRNPRLIRHRLTTNLRLYFSFLSSAQDVFVLIYRPAATFGKLTLNFFISNLQLMRLKLRVFFQTLLLCCSSLPQQHIFVAYPNCNGRIQCSQSGEASTLFRHLDHGARSWTICSDQQAYLNYSTYSQAHPIDLATPDFILSSLVHESLLFYLASALLARTSISYSPPFPPNRGDFHDFLIPYLKIDRCFTSDICVSVSNFISRNF